MLDNKNDNDNFTQDNNNSSSSSSSSNNNNNNKQQQQQQQPKSRRLGRAARRRKNKIRAIQQSVQILLLGSDTNNKNSGAIDQENAHDSQEIDGENIIFSCLPTDRSHTLPGVIIRRKQFNNYHSTSSDNNHAVVLPQGDEFGIDKKDKTMLTSQLGFIPGNAIAVVSRVNHIETLYPRLFKLLTTSSKKIDDITTGTCINDSKNVENQKNQNQKIVEWPLVLQLYPLVMRDVYEGGKSHGRKYKSRKRGHLDAIESSKSDSSRNNSSNNNNACKSERKSTEEGKDNTLFNHSFPNKTNTTTIEPFPTIYWLTHPHLKTLISQLEIEPTQNVKTVEEKIASSPYNTSAMQSAHELYGNTRWKLLTDEDKVEMEKRKWVDALGCKRGVAGIKNFKAVKCLHAHAAHYLAQCGSHNIEEQTSSSQDDSLGENLVGKWVLEAVEELIFHNGSFEKCK